MATENIDDMDEKEYASFELREQHHDVARECLGTGASMLNQLGVIPDDGRSVEIITGEHIVTVRKWIWRRRRSAK